MQKDESTENNNEMPVSNPTMGKIAKTIMLVSSFTIVETVILIAVNMVISSAYEGIIGVLSSADTMTERDANIAIAMMSLLAIIPFIVFMVITIKKLSVMIEYLDKIYQKEFE